LKADPERLTQTVRAAALDVDAGPVWIERAVVSTHPLRSELADGLVGAGPLADLGREIAALRSDPAALAAFVAELPALADLARKMRPASGVAPLAEPATLLEDAQELLLARLAELERS
jgi:hypothetical protein